MTGTIVKKEIASNLLSYKFFVVILLTTLLLATSFFVLAKDFKGRKADYELVRAKPGEAIAVLAPNPMSIFAKGLDEAMTRSFEINQIGIDVRAGQKSGNAIFAFFPAPDFVYIVKVVLSLVALLFGFDQISRERETGVLRLVLANSVSRAKVLAGKWLGNYLSLAVPFALVTLIGFALMNLDPQISFGAAGTARFIVLLAVALMYIALFLSLGLLISALTKKAASSLVVLLLIWAVAVFVLPNIGTLLARQMVDVPSVKALSEKRQQTWTREVLLAITESRKGREGGWDAARKEHFGAINTEFDKLEADYRVKFDKLVRLSKNINRVSPAASFVYAATELAGTGIAEEGLFKAGVVRYKNTVLPAMDQGKKEFPAFSYKYRTIGQVMVQGGLFDVAWLAIFTIVLFAGGYAAFVRYDVR